MESVDSSMDNIRHLFHRDHVYLPRILTIVLKVEPSLLSSIIQAYHHGYQTQTNHELEIDYGDLVVSDVLITKGLYALLVQTPLQHPLWLVTEEAARVKHELGQKLVRGVEILVKKAKEHLINPLSTPNMEDLEKNPEWIKYLKNLKDSDFFQKADENSPIYQERLDKAYEYYVINIYDLKHRQYVIAGTTLLDMIGELENRPKEWSEAEDPVLPADSSAWMYDDNGEVRHVYKREDVLNAGTRKSSNIRKVSCDMYRKLSVGANYTDGSRQQRKVSNISLISTLSRKISEDIGCFSDEYSGILDLYIPEDDFASDDDSEMNCYGSELAHKVLQHTRRSTSTEPANRDEFCEVDDFRPVPIDVKTLDGKIDQFRRDHNITVKASNIFSRLKTVLAERKKL